MFVDNEFYLTSDPALKVLGSVSTLAHWRSEGRGPAFVKISAKRVAYRGSDLNEWLTRQVVKPTA